MSNETEKRTLSNDRFIEGFNEVIDTTVARLLRARELENTDEKVLAVVSIRHQMVPDDLADLAGTLAFMNVGEERTKEVFEFIRGEI